MSNTRTAPSRSQRRNLPLVVLSLAPAMLLAACNTQEKQELAAAIDRANEAAQRAESAQHAAEAAAVRARSDKLAAARDTAEPAEEQKSDQPADAGPAPAQGQESLPQLGRPG